MRNKSIAYLCLLLPALCVMACQQERDLCLEPKIVNVRIGTYRIADSSTAIIDSLLPNANLIAVDNDSLKGWAIGAKKYNKFTLLLSPKYDSCVWIIQPDSGYNPIDTLVFHYKRQLQFLSTGCGFTYFYTISKIKATGYVEGSDVHGIDSVIVSNGSVTNNANIEHVKIYYHKH